MTPSSPCLMRLGFRTYRPDIFSRFAAGFATRFAQASVEHRSTIDGLVGLGVVDFWVVRLGLFRAWPGLGLVAGFAHPIAAVALLPVAGLLLVAGVLQRRR